MCGFAGIVDPSGSLEVASLIASVERMAEVLSHRGPDGNGRWVDAAYGVAFGFRRLAIIDRSSAGAQPMISCDGRFVLVFNGEIYNHRVLRADLEREGKRFRGRSDTEVLFTGLQHWGPERMLARCNGMFAFALWDRLERSLVLARDPMGEKPLYYGVVRRSLVFGSELKAIRAFCPAALSVDPVAAQAYFRMGYVPTPRSIYEGVHKLVPGTWLRLQGNEFTRLPEPTPYWGVRDAVEGARADPFHGTDADAVDRLEAQLRASTALRMHADVPVGAFLSGGVDSATVVALMQSESMRPVKTFTIANPEPDFDEAGRAREIAHHLGTEHEEFTVTSPEAAAVIPDMAHVYDEPFGDSTALPTFLLSRLARASVTVSLSGDGGDELFGGYHRHVFGPRLWQQVHVLPRPMVDCLATAVTSVSPAVIDRAYRMVEPVLPRRLRQTAPGSRLHNFAASMTAADLDELHARLSTQWERAAMTRGSDPGSGGGGGSTEWHGSASERLMLLDQLSYLPDNNLAMLDRATMAWGLEARVPLLDRNVVEFSWRLPSDTKVRGSVGKWALRQVLARYVPSPLTHAPKRGFSVDIGSWLRGPLRDWAETLLDPRALANSGVDVETVRGAWRDHLAGRCDAARRLWVVLMFQSWAETRS